MKKIVMQTVKSDKPSLVDKKLGCSKFDMTWNWSIGWYSIWWDEVRERICYMTVIIWDKMDGKEEHNDDDDTASEFWFSK